MNAAVFYVIFAPNYKAKQSLPSTVWFVSVDCTVVFVFYVY